MNRVLFYCQFGHCLNWESQQQNKAIDKQRLCGPKEIKQTAEPQGHGKFETVQSPIDFVSFFFLPFSYAAKFLLPLLQQQWLGFSLRN